MNIFLTFNIRNSSPQNIYNIGEHTGDHLPKKAKLLITFLPELHTSPRPPVYMSHVSPLSAPASPAVPLTKPLT